MSYYHLIELPTFQDTRGILTVLEGVITFDIKRIYWIYEADSMVRGGHRHHHTRQALIAISGIVNIFMNDGIRKETITLDSANKCLLVEPKDWHSMQFGKDAILLVIASEKYNSNDYIDVPY